jgi:ABC-type bacteriocin/lantibiotic exporter with double-glycine peptidase domain
LIISNIQNVFVIFSLIFSVILYLIIFNKEFFKKTSQNVRQFSFEMNKFGPLVLKFFKEIRIYNKEKVFFEKFKNIINLQVNTEIITKKINYGLRTFIEISFFFTTIIYFIYLLKVTNMENSIALFANLFVVMIRITPIFNIILRTYSDLKIRNANIIKTENYIKKFPLENQIYDYGNNFQKVEQVETFEIRNFNYNNSKNESIFKNAFFEFNRKQKIYINGNSGSGKTTLLDVISGINFDYNGTILINGKERSKVEAKNILKRRVGYVSQPAYLMPGSIKENITFAFSNDLIDKRRLDNALEKSGLLGELNKFKDGIETYLVTPMQNISEGQKQRIFIARSIYFERDIIVLDEATSGLDKKSEKSILQSLLKQENLTIILVSHHLTFLDGFDAVYKIQNCEILDEKKI